MEARSIIIAENEKDFTYQLCEITKKVFFDIAINGIGNIVAVQFKDAPPFAIEEYIDRFKRVDGQYTYKGKFVTRNEIYKELEKFSKEVSISIVPKDLGKGFIDENKYRKSFGYINYTEIRPAIRVEVE